MSSSSTEYKADKTFHYDGIEVTSIFDINDSLTNSISQDSLIDNVYTSKEDKSYAMALPTSVNLSYTKKWNEKWKSQFGVFNRMLANYFPYIYANTSYYFSQNILAQFHFSYGGYGKFNVGISAAANINNKVQLFVGSYNLNAFVVPKSTFANSGFGGIKVLF